MEVQIDRERPSRANPSLRYRPMSVQKVISKPPHPPSHPFYTLFSLEIKRQNPRFLDNRLRPAALSILFALPFIPWWWATFRFLRESKVMPEAQMVCVPLGIPIDFRESFVILLKIRNREFRTSNLSSNCLKTTKLLSRENLLLIIYIWKNWIEKKDIYF